MYRFSVIDGPGKGGAGFELKSSPSIIGRGFEAEILLDSQDASRKHACVTLMGDEVFIHTVTDKLDTLVNGKAITRDARRPVKLRSGDKIQICDVVLELCNPGDEFRRFTTQSSAVASEPVPGATPSFPSVAQSPTNRPDSGRQVRIESAVPESQDVSEPARDVSNDSNSTPISRVNISPLNVYIMLDVSGSMAGEPLEAAISGLQSLITEAINERSEFLVSMITYGPAARMEFTRTRCHDVRLPQLKAGGFSALGQALQLLAQNLAEGGSGSFSETPNNSLVFVIGDGHGTDEPHKQLAEWRTDLCTMLLCVLGPRVPSPALLNACEFAVSAEKSADFRKTFDWIQTVIRQRAAGDALPTEVGAPLKVISRPASRNAR